MNDSAALLSGFAATLRFADLDAATVEQVKMYLADYLAACYAGYRINREFNEAVCSLFEDAGGKEEALPVLGKKRLPADSAAFISASFAHGADMDDGNRKARGHVAAHVMSAVFALAETRSVTWGEVFTAIIVGYEVYNRTAAAAQPELVHRGFHSTGTAGAAACAAACAKLLGLDASGIYSAIGLAALQSGGLLIVTESGQANKPLSPANAARIGLMSARLAEKGLRGPDYPLDSKKGWFHAMGAAHENEVTDGLGTSFTINGSYLKPYPSCRHTHCGIEAAGKLRKRLQANGKTIADITEIRVYIYPDAIAIAGQTPIPATPEEAKFSVQYTLAVALQNGSFTLDDLEAPITDESRRIVSKINLIPDPEKENSAAGIRGAAVELLFADGTSDSETVLLPKGDAANPFTRGDMEQKLADCMAGLRPAADARVILDTVFGIDPTAPFAGVNALL